MAHCGLEELSICILRKDRPVRNDIAREKLQFTQACMKHFFYFDLFTIAATSAAPTATIPLTIARPMAPSVTIWISKYEIISKIGKKI